MLDKMRLCNAGVERLGKKEGELDALLEVQGGVAGGGAGGGGFS
jgi:hypothetical protein